MPLTSKRNPPSSPEFDFFIPSASTFKPRPYVPSSSLSASRGRFPQISRTPSGASDSLSSTAPPLDPSPNEPNVLFLHPPFNDFPNAHLHSSGLTYSLMAENPDWFLDARDFKDIDASNENLHAISYPPSLEPPRGWCPAKKRDKKDRGTESWREGEEPRLRCTFCRRTYAGVNAKSMWRRHVFEKHRIAMANRRETGDRPRGRNAIKENRHPAVKEAYSETVLAIQISPQSISHCSSQRTKFRSRPPLSDDRRRKRHRTRSSSLEELSAPSEDETSREFDIQPVTPPLTSRKLSSHIMDLGDQRSTRSPTPLLVPPSPYDPSVTPSFLHSSPALPSHQPWRSSSQHDSLGFHRNIPLTLLVRDSAPSSPTPVVSVMNTGDLSPCTSHSAQEDIFQTADNLLSGYTLSHLLDEYQGDTPAYHAQPWETTILDVDPIALALDEWNVPSEKCFLGAYS